VPPGQRSRRAWARPRRAPMRHLTHLPRPERIDVAFQQSGLDLIDARQPNHHCQAITPRQPPSMGASMVTEITGKNAYASQRSIYDERYAAGRYDHRSAVRVLTAERNALNGAVQRAIRSNPAVPVISLFDFGYGTGRVTNEFIEMYVRNYAKSKKNLLVVAYDVSSSGLMKAKEALCSKGFVPVSPIDWIPDDNDGYIAGRISKTENGLTVTVVFVHGNEAQPPSVMHRLALRANGGEKYLITTSWYSGLGHVPHERRRRQYFCQLGLITSWHGEMVISLSSTGDLPELQPEWSERQVDGICDFPIRAQGDVVYETELGQSNFYHVFGTELNDHMAAITPRGQFWWMEGIRYPGEEFASRRAERFNYCRVRWANRPKRGRRWNAADFQEFHTVAAFRSPLGPPQPWPSRWLGRWSARRLLLLPTPDVNDAQRREAGTREQAVGDQVRRSLSQPSAACGRDGLAAGPGQIAQAEGKSLLKL
jgi:hypothetical protein